MVANGYHPSPKGHFDIDSMPPKPPTNARDHVVKEFLDTERSYLFDMERLESYRNDLWEQKVVPRDVINRLFGNFTNLIHFQREFAAQLEATAAKALEEQRFGALFIRMENDFCVYEPYCTNFYAAQDLVIQQTEHLVKLASTINPVYELPSMLIKPVQRICRYPLLLSELIKSTHTDASHLAEMQEGLNAIKRVAERVNETKRRHDNKAAAQELKKRLSEEEGSTIEQHDDLLIYGKVTMIRNDKERELQLYLFEKALLVFKESKESARSRLAAKSSTLSLRKKRRSSLQAKSKILVTKLVKVVNRTRDRLWHLEVGYRGEKGEIEKFLLQFSNEELLKQWEDTLNRLIRRNPQARHIPLSRSQSRNARAFDFSDEEDSASDSSSVHGGTLSNDSFISPVRYPVSPPPSYPPSPIVNSISPVPTGNRYHHHNVHQRALYSSDHIDTLPRPSLGRFQSHSTTGCDLGVRPRVTDLSFLQRSRSQSSPNIHDRPVKDEGRPHATLKVKLICENCILVIVVPQNISYFDIMERVENKMKKTHACDMASESFLLKYEDEDGDLITISSDEDVTMAFENPKQASTVTLLVVTP